jgi:hypothetical protein
MLNLGTVNCHCRQVGRTAACAHIRFSIPQQESVISKGGGKLLPKAVGDENGKQQLDVRSSSPRAWSGHPGLSRAKGNPESFMSQGGFVTG